MPQPARPICYRSSLGYRPGRYPKNLLDSTIFLSWQLLAIRKISPVIFYLYPRQAYCPQLLDWLVLDNGLAVAPAPYGTLGSDMSPLASWEWGTDVP